MNSRLWLSVVLLALFAGVAVAARAERFPGDGWVAVHLHCDDFVLYSAVEQVGEMPVWTALVLAASAVLWRTVGGGAALLVVVADLSTEVLGTLARLVVDRQATVSGVPGTGFESMLAPGVFPSGHVLRATVTLGILVLLAAWYAPRWRRRALLAAGLFLVLLGLSMIEVRAHWLSDEVGALLLGGAWLNVLWVMVWPWLRALGQSSPTRVRSPGRGGTPSAWHES